MAGQIECLQVPSRFLFYQAKGHAKITVRDSSTLILLPLHHPPVQLSVGLVTTRRPIPDQIDIVPDLIDLHPLKMMHSARVSRVQVEYCQI